MPVMAEAASSNIAMLRLARSAKTFGPNAPAIVAEFFWNASIAASSAAGVTSTRVQPSGSVMAKPLSATSMRPVVARLAAGVAAPPAVGDASGEPPGATEAGAGVAWVVGADVAVDAVGAGLTKRTALAAARPGGAAVWIGLHENAMSLDSFDVTLPEKKVFGTYAATRDDLRLALELMATGKVDAKTWTTRLPLAEAEQAFRRALAARGADIKMIVGP